MKKLALVALAIVAFLGTNAGAFFLNVPPVTKYTDNTAIEPTVGIFIDAWVDGVPLATMFPQGYPVTKIPLIDNTYGAVHTYKVRTHLSDGRMSIDYDATITSPLDDRTPAPPGAPLSISK